nr:PhnO protein [Kibdelosporangium sp. MJ126-NF4]
MAELMAELGHPGSEVESVRRRLQRWADYPDGTALVSERDGDIVGVIAVLTTPFLERDGNWGRIVALVTTESARGKGVGRELTTAAEEFARDRGCVRMEVTSANRRADAHAFYQRMGYANWADRSARFIKLFS